MNQWTDSQRFGTCCKESREHRHTKVLTCCRRMLAVESGTVSVKKKKHGKQKELESYFIPGLRLVVAASESCSHHLYQHRSWCGDKQRQSTVERATNPCLNWNHWFQFDPRIETTNVPRWSDWELYMCILFHICSTTDVFSRSSSNLTDGFSTAGTATGSCICLVSVVP